MSSELDGLCCPLTLEVFAEPVTLVGDGHTYERASIQEWLDSGKLTSPTTGAVLGAGGLRLVPNYAVKRTIAELCLAPPADRAVAAVTAAAEVLAVATERPPEMPPPPPQDHRITAQFSEQGRGFSDGHSSCTQNSQGFADGNNSVTGGASFGLGHKVIDSSKGKGTHQFQERGHVVNDKATHQFQERGHVINNERQSFSESSGSTWFGWGRKKTLEAGPRGRQLEALEEKSSEEDAPLGAACDALLVGGALRGGGSLAADGTFGTLVDEKRGYRSLQCNARADAKILRLCAPQLNAGLVLTCGQTRGVSAFRWRDYEEKVKGEKTWWDKKGKTTKRRRCWEKNGDLKGARDWCTTLASDTRGTYAVAGCRGGDLRLWRPPKAHRSGVVQWVEAGVAERSHASSRMRSDVRAVAVEEDTIVSGGTDWCVRLWDARTLQSKGALGDITRAEKDPDENYDDDVRGHNYPITCVDMRSHLVASGGEDKRVMLWDCRTKDGAVACYQRDAPVTVVKFAGQEHELLVAGEHGVSQIIDTRTGKPSTTLMQPAEWDQKTKENGVWEGYLKHQHPILDACVSPTGDRISLLAWRPAGGVIEVFEAASWSRVATIDLAAELPRISPSSIAAARLPAGR
jgi:hypothetical protein